MKYFRFILAGIIFGIVMIKSEAVSWFRIYEMFHFRSFHMYGIIGTAVLLGIVGVSLIKKYKLKDFNGNPIYIEPKESGKTRYLVGGILFGLGWALVGTCPGPVFVLIGAGFYPILIVLGGAILGTFLYGCFKKYLPH